MNFYDQVAATAARFPSHIAVEVQRRDRVDAFRYDDLMRMSDAVAAWLEAQGIAAGDRCALLAENTAEWCAAYLGIMRLGAVAVPLDTAYNANQIAKLLRDCDARIIFTSPRFAPAVGGGLERAGTRCPAALLGEPADEAAALPWVPFRAPAAALAPCPATESDPAVILYTSGTTSDPKGVVLTHANLLAEKDGAFRVIHVDERDCVLGVLPLFHALAQMANLLLPFSIGARVVFLETVNSTELLRSLHERGVTAFACVPQFFYLIHERVVRQVAASSWARRALFRTFTSVNGWMRRALGLNAGPILFRRVHQALGVKMRLLITGGSRLDPAVGRDLYKLGFNILQAYGLTETSGAATLMRPDDPHVESVGPPLPGVEVHIAAAESTEDADVRDGEVLIKGPIVMAGYYNRPEVNAVALTDGWLHTGDLGYLDAQGRVHITGRKKELIVLSSGKNIYPEELEAHYMRSPYIKELCVLARARADEPAAERLHAVIVPDIEAMRARRIVNTREVLRYELESLSVQLPSHKRILGYDVWLDPLPRTTTGKLKRFEIERRLRGTATAAQTVAMTTEDDAAWRADAHVERALGAIHQALKSDALAIAPSSNLELDLGLDSMERVELLTTLGEMFGIDVPEEEAQRIYTVGELVEAVRPAADGSGAGAAKAQAWERLLASAETDDPMLAELLKPKGPRALLLFGVVKLLYGFARVTLRFRVTEWQCLPAQGPFILSPNHESYLDPFLLVAALPFRIFRDLFFVGASEYFETPLMRWVARTINVVPVDPDSNLLRAMQAGAFGLRHGKVLILFPEGERSIDGEVKTFKKGAAILSLHIGVPIVPVGLTGIFEVWPRQRPFNWRAFLPGSGVRVGLRFGRPLQPPARSQTSTEPLARPHAGGAIAAIEQHYAKITSQLRDTVIELRQHRA